MSEVVSNSGNVQTLDPASPRRALGEHRYAALMAGIRGEREPTPQEIKRVAARMLREIGATNRRQVDLKTHRGVLRAAKVALSGI